jgi:uncharacterized protein YigE (DUF2233 family)
MVNKEKIIIMKKFSGTLLINILVIIGIVVLIYFKATEDMPDNPRNRNQIDDAKDINGDEPDIEGPSRYTGDISQAYQVEKIDFRGNSYDTISIDTGMAQLELYWKDDNGVRFADIAGVKSFVEEEAGRELIFATNAGSYNKNQAPLGLYIEGGRKLVNNNLGDGFGDFYLKPNGIFLINYDGESLIIRSEDYFRVRYHKIWIASQSGPMLLYDGEVHPSFNKGSQSKFIRNGVGIDDMGRVVFAISNQPVNFYDFAMLFKSPLRCDDALYLDGGVSQMYLPELSRRQTGGDFAGIFALVK